MTLRPSLGKVLALATLVAGTFAAAPAQAGPCDLEIAGNDSMQFDKTALSVPASCKQFTLTLKHSGKLPAAAMGHNWVLARSADVAGIASDGIAAGLPNGYLKPGDARVVANTKMLGAGGSDTITVDAGKLKAGESYAYFCSFPGHSSVMKGTFSVAK